MSLDGLWPEDGWTALDDDHVYRLVSRDGEVVGLIEAHRQADGEWCRGGIYWVQIREGAPIWTLVSLDPLHVEPSLLCRRCGSHGFIRGGTWVGV